MAEMASGTGLGVLRAIQANDESAAAAHHSPPVTLLGGEHIHVIRQGITTIGRGLQNTLVLLDPAVSREHACLCWERGAWSVENVSRHNPLGAGTRELGPGERAELAPGDTLRLGHTTLQLLAPIAAGAAPFAGEPAGGDPPSGEMAINLMDPGVTMQFALSGRIAPRGRWVLLGLGALLFVASAVVTLGTAALVGVNALATQGAGAVLAAATIPLAPALGAALLVGAIDRYEREPAVVLVGAFAWGALIAIPAALFLESGLNAWLQAAWGGAAAPAAGGALVVHSALRGLGAGLTEEAVKGAGLLVLLWALHDEFDNVTDGIVYGIMIGAGFAMVENFVYFATSPRGDLGFLVLGRVVLGWLGHSTFTALFGAGLGYAREIRGRGRQALAPLAGLVAAVLLHSLFDFVDFQANAAVHMPHVSQLTTRLALMAVLADYVPLFLAQALLLHLLVRALRREAATVREYLAAEIPAGVVTPDEYAVLQKANLRARLEHHYLLAWGPRAYLLARALHQTATGLAFRKWHVAMGDRPKATPRQPEEVYRERIARLRRSLLQLIGDESRSSSPAPESAERERPPETSMAVPPDTGGTPG
jgi:RsiW-degrading membrane proteinase PrsW (M82 family)